MTVIRPVRWLSADEVKLLTSVTADRDPELLRIVRSLEAHQILDASSATTIRNAIANELLATGIDSEFGALNERGLALDDLVARVGELSRIFE